MIGRRNILAMLGMAPAAMASQTIRNPAEANYVHGLGSLAADSMSGSSIFRDAFSDHEELDRKKKSLAALKQLRAAGFRNESYLYERCPNIDSRRATSPAIKQLLHRDVMERRELERREADIHNFTIRMLLPPGIKDWL